MTEHIPEDKSFAVTEESRHRWNVLDMITVIAKDTVPTYLFMDIDMTWAESVRKNFKSLGRKITVTAILLKAIAIAQRAHPASRTAALPFGKRAILQTIVAGFTVERFVGAQPAVYFGAIEKPDTKPLEKISEELQEYSEADMQQVSHLSTQHWFNHMPWLFRQIVLWVGQRFPSVRLQHMPATFGLSSLGKFGIKALIPPCASTSTFGIGEVEHRPVVRNGKIEIRPMMTLSLNFDHRMIDGAPAARFLQDIKALLEGGLESYLTDEKEPEIETQTPPQQQLTSSFG
jgi:pyruvate/2-oxoglutarate dehydrogenase complex dihydrolipoamide acyltransferase (E2) component